MSIAFDILTDLYNKTHYYKGVRVNIFGLPVSKKYKTSSFRGSAYRLRTDGLIDKDTSGWYITKNGENYFKTHKSFKRFDSVFSDKSKKDLLIIFDITQDKRAERDWLRWQLRKFGYKMVQRSVWVGPSPLPIEFKKYTAELKIKDDIKTFKLSKNYRFNE